MYQINLQKSISYLCDPRELPNEGVYFLNNLKKNQSSLIIKCTEQSAN